MREDPAEAETEQRRVSGAASFDRLAEATLGLITSNVQLMNTVRVAIIVWMVGALLLMAWSAFETFTMRATMGEMRAMLQTILDTLAKARP